MAEVEAKKSESSTKECQIIESKDGLTHKDYPYPSLQIEVEAKIVEHHVSDAK